MKKNICFIGISTILGGVSAGLGLIGDIFDNRQQQKEQAKQYTKDLQNKISNITSDINNIGLGDYSFNSNTDLNRVFAENRYENAKNALSNLKLDVDPNDFGAGSKIVSDGMTQFTNGIDYANAYLKTLESIDNFNKINAVNRMNDMKNRSLAFVGYEDGGTINGMNMDNGTTQFNGYKHGQGAYSGIPIGMNADGGLNIAEGGEVRDNENDYIYSDSFIISKKDIEKYGLPKKYEDKTIAEAAKLASKESDERGPGDNISKNTKESVLRKLRAFNDEKLAERQLMEQLKAIKENRMDLLQEEAARQAMVEQEQMARQQALAEQQSQMQNMQGQAIQDPAMQQLEQQQIMQQPQMFEGGGNTWKERAEKSSKWDSKENTTNWTDKNYKKWLRREDKLAFKAARKDIWDANGVGEIAGVVGNTTLGILGPAIGAILTKKPDYSVAESVKNSITKPTPITPKEVSLSLPNIYNPKLTNIDYFINQANNAYASTLASLKSQGLTPGQYMAAATNANRQYYNTIGETMLKGYERNDAERKYALESANKAIETMNQQKLYNTDTYNKALQFNTGLEQVFNQQNLEANKYHADIVHALDMAYSEALSRNISDIFTNTAGAFRTLWGAKAAETENYKGVAGKVKPVKFGGNINRRKRRRYGK